MGITLAEFRHSTDNIIYLKNYNFSFNGTGVDDLSFSGQFYKPVNAVIEIDSVGAIDTFKLSVDGGVTWILTLQPITGYQQLWDYDITVIWASVTGHTIGDQWIALGSQDAYGLTWFQTQEPAYNLPLIPAGIINQWYIQEGVQSLMPYPIPSRILQTGRTEYVTQGIWADGDTYISKKSDYMAAYRQNVFFSGVGLDDMTCNGIFYLDPPSITIEIDANGTPDTFKVSFDGGSTWDSTGNAITGSAQTILTTSFGNDVTIIFSATTEHTLGDRWTINKTVIN